MEKIFIYSDKGVGMQSFFCARGCLRGWGNGKYAVKALSAAEVIEGSWVNEEALFVMPGGASTPYSEKLKGEGINRIRDFVKNGGSYLGICAGAYFGAERTSFNKGMPDEIENECQTGLFKGTASGPVFPPYDPDSNAGCKAVEIDARGTGKFKVFYNGGCSFQADEGFKDYETVAVYSQKGNEVAVIFLPFGAGRVVLSGVHFEFSPGALDMKDAYQAPLRNILIEYENERISFINEIAAYLRMEGITK